MTVEGGAGKAIVPRLGAGLSLLEPLEGALNLSPHAYRNPMSEPRTNRLTCRSCGSGHGVLIVEFAQVECDCGAPPFPHLYAEPVCEPCRAMLQQARNHFYFMQARN